MTNKEAINYLKRNMAIDEDDANRYHNEVLEFTIKALGQEPCEDAISREAVKELFQEGSVMGMYHFLGIDELPSVTPKKDGWIPCNEKLPKPNELVDNVRKYYLIQDEYGDMHVASYLRNGWISIDSFYTLEDDVLAWMPLPKRYEYEGDNNDK